MFKQVELADNWKPVKDKLVISLQDWMPSAYDKMIPNKTLHDTNFAFVSTKLAKLHEQAYVPLWWTTYRQDVPVDVGGGFVDFVEYFKVNYKGIVNAATNLTGNNATIVPRINANLKQATARVYTFQMAYDLSFVELEKLDTIRFQKAITEIYNEGIMIGFELFAQTVAYTGAEGTGDNGLFNNPNVKVYSVPAGVSTNTKFSEQTDEELVSFFNGVMAEYLEQTNWNLGMLPDTFLLPKEDARELSDRISALLTKNLRMFIEQNNYGVDEMRSDENAMKDYRFRIKSRPDLDSLGTFDNGRIVVYRKDRRFLRMDLPYPLQMHYTGPNVERASYTSIFVAQLSAVHMPYNDGETGEFGPVTYWDFAAA
jgi:hypothetical protein